MFPRSQAEDVELSPYHAPAMAGARWVFRARFAGVAETPFCGLLYGQIGSDYPLKLQIFLEK